VHAPQTFIGAAARAIPDHGGWWLTDTFALGERVSPWFTTTGAVVLGLVAFVLVAAQRSDDEHLRPQVPARVTMVGLAVAGYLAVIAGWLLYCAAPEMSVINHPHVRLLLPVLPALALGLAPAGRLGLRLARSPVPLSLLILAVDAAFVVDLGLTMR
jgi:hypothetical protein